MATASRAIVEQGGRVVESDASAEVPQQRICPRSPGVDHRLSCPRGELMFVEAVRAHLEALPPGHDGWFAALRDPLVASALALLHRGPAERWTLERLAEACGISRSALAERFHRSVGQPPCNTWPRGACNSRRGCSPSRRRVKTSAQAVGYDSESAFSRAFKRALGLAPAEWRHEEAR